MHDAATIAGENTFMKSALETVIQVGSVVLLMLWCFDIVKPFIGVIAWGIIIVIAVRPLYERLALALDGRRGAASVIFTLSMLLLLITPTAALVDTLVEGSRHLATEFSDGQIHIPPPPNQLTGIPVIGPRLEAFWVQTSLNLSAALNRFRPQIEAASKWLLSAAASAGVGVLTFALAIVIAGVVLVSADRGQQAARRILTRLAGKAGEAYAELIASTIRSVAQGILGVALIQTVLAGLGFLAAGIPGAGVLAVVTLFLCIIQLGPTLVLLPVVVYVFMTADPVPAFAFLAWSLFVALIDNFLKPLLLGRGVDVPVAVVFIGAIGGFISMGIIGLFVGSTVLALGYTLVVKWLDEEQTESLPDTQA